MEWLHTFFLQHSREGLLSLTEPLSSLPSPGLASLLSRCVQGSRPQSTESPTTWIMLEVGSYSVPPTPKSMVFLLSKHNPTLPQPLSLPFVSPQKGMPPLCAYAAHFISPNSQSRTYDFPNWPTGPWRCFCHSVAWIPGILSLLASVLLCLRNEGTWVPLLLRHVDSSKKIFLKIY